MNSNYFLADHTIPRLGTARYCRRPAYQLQARMISISWWVAVLVYMSIYWPITAMIAAAMVMTALLGTNSVGWRAFWSVLAFLIVAPVIWFYTLA